MHKLLSAAAIGLVALNAWAGPRTVALDLPTMNCAMCSITVKKALGRVDGVVRAEVSYEKKQALVTFEDGETDTAALIEATTNAGYPSTIVQPVAQ